MTRIGALRALEALGQDNSDYRQAVVDLINDYLQIPATLPDN